MGFPAHPDFIGKDADTTSNPKRYAELGSCAFRVNFLVVTSNFFNPFSRLA